MKPNVPNAVFLDPDAVGAPGTVAMPGAAVSYGQPGAGAAHFTPRQREVLALLCEGLPNKLICRRLNIAAGTVKVHISCILRELGVASRLQAVVAARSHGLVATASEEDRAMTQAKPGRGGGTSTRGTGIGI